MKMHIVALPTTNTTEAYLTCAYTQKVVKFCNAMSARGHEIYLYGGYTNSARCKEFVPCITKEEQALFGFKGPEDYQKIIWEPTEDIFQTFNPRVIDAIRARHQERDLILMITSWPNLPVFEAFPHPHYQVIEFGIGYQGPFAQYQVFESHAWRNFVYGINRRNGDFFHEVIYNYFDPDDFPFGAATDREDYMLFIGRLNWDKGIDIARQTCEKLGIPLRVAGPGNWEGYGEHVGVVGRAERAELMSRAKAVFVPTLYVGPFEGVHVEANLCGTPVITTDWGIFPETVANFENGLRCKMFAEFLDAAAYYHAGLHPHAYSAIRSAAQRKFSTDVIMPQYEEYFERVQTLWGEGFYELDYTRPDVVE